MRCRNWVVNTFIYYHVQGLIQSVFELHDGSGVVVTIGKYVTPGHSDINGNGIEPDFHNIPSKSPSCPLSLAKIEAFHPVVNNPLSAQDGVR